MDEIDWRKFAISSPHWEPAPTYVSLQMLSNLEEWAENNGVSLSNHGDFRLFNEFDGLGCA